MRIQHNIAAVNAHRQLGGNNDAVARNLEKLSSGYRINKAGDDAAGLSISEKMRAQIKGLETAQKNAQDGVSLIQTAEGNLTEVHSMLNRMVELATQSANGTYANLNREELQKEVTSLTGEIDRIASSANFNGIKLLNGSLDSAVQGTGTANGAKAALVEGATFTNVAAVKDKFVGKAAIGTFAAGANSQATFTLSYMDKDGNTVSKSFDTAAGNYATAGGLATGIKTAFEADSELSALFNIDITGDKISLESKTAGANAPKAQSFTIAQKTGSGQAYTPTTNEGVRDTTSVAGANASGNINIGTPAAGKSVTIGNKTYEFATNATDTVKEGSIRVLTGGNATDSRANLINAMKANGVSSAAVGANAGDISISDLKEIAVDQKGISISSDSMGVLINNTAATAGKYNLSIGVGANGGTSTFSVKYMDAAGKEQIAQVDYTATNNAATNRDAILAALQGNDALKDVFDMKADGGGGIDFTAKATGSNGGRFISGSTSDPTNTAVGGLTISEGKDAGKTLAFKNDDIKTGDTFTVGGKTYEFVSDLNKKPSGTGNVAVVKGATDADTLKSVAALLKADGVEMNSDGTKISFKDGSVQPSKGLTLQVGETNDSFQKVTVSVGNMNAASLGLGSITVGNQDDAAKAMTAINAAIDQVSSTRGDLGALQNRLDHTINNLGVTTENMSAAESRIRDVDMAKEMMDFTKNNILTQAAQAMLAQANNLPQGVLQLLK